MKPILSIRPGLDEDVCLTGHVGVKCYIAFKDKIDPEADYSLCLKCFNKQKDEIAAKAISKTSSSSSS